MKKIPKSLVTLAESIVFLFSFAFAQDISSVVSANNQFACELYSRYSSQTENIFFSPYSISSAIAMAYEGARGQTADEIRLVLHFPKDETLLRESFLEINNFINKKDKEYTLRSANALWAQKDYQFLPDYFSLIEKYYSGKVQNLDFKEENAKSCQIINSWIENQTNDRIKNLISSLKPATRLILTNAVYFKGFWFKQFKKKDTRDEDFEINPGNKIKVPMMHLNGTEAEFNYAETDKLQILELPYKGEDLSMLILLPKKNNLTIVENSLTIEKISEWIGLFEKAEIDISLPKFKFEKEYSLKGALAEMGMPSAFTYAKADFSGMTGKKDLYIDKILHKAFVEVNEEGTEAAAATSVFTQALGCAPNKNKIKVFKADHPFIFIIQETKSGNILFAGRVSNPTK